MFSTTSKAAKDTILEGELTQVETRRRRAEGAGSQREAGRWTGELTALVAKHGGGGAKRGSGAGPPALQGLARRQSRRLERRSSAEPYAPPRRGSSTGLTPRMASLGGGPSGPGWDEGSAPKPPKAAFPPPPKDRRGSGVARAAAARKAETFPNPPAGRAAGGASMRQRGK